MLQTSEKLEHNTYCYFNVTVQLTTFEGAHDFPFDLVTITFSNKYSMEWQAVDIKAE
ncbi:DUF3888 domain-containing protein [Bacillus infantis]|nr:DUF3888 domain-containing protein [Bacillus infantis]